jgi:branched-chain amino acid transport system substrate-binding protein
VNTTIRRFRWMAIPAVLGLVLTACGGDGGGTAEPTSTGGATTPAGEDTETSAEPFESPADGVFVDRVDYGLIYDQTGPTASTQLLFGHGILSYFKMVNDDGGVNGRQIRAIEEDEKYEVPVGVAAFNKLVNDTPVVGITGANNSSLQGAIIEDVDDWGVPIIGPESTTKVAVNPFRDYFFAMECTYADQADVAVAYAATLAGADHTAVTIYGNVASGEEYHELIQERTEHGGGTYAGFVTIEYGSTEADAQAQQIASLNPDVIHLHGGVSIGIPVLKSLEKFGITDVPVIGIFAMHNDPVATAANVPFNVVNCYSNGYDDVEGTAPMIEAAKAAGYPEEEYRRPEFVNGWVVGMVIVEGMKRAGNELTRESLKEAVASITDFDTGQLSPTVSFGSDNRVGVAAVKPFAYDRDSGVWSGVGEYSDWGDCLTNEYVTETLEGYDPGSCSTA